MEPDYHNDGKSKQPVAPTLGGPDLDDAAIAAFAEMGAKILTPFVVAGARWIADTWPATPGGVLVPPHGRRLFVRARRAYRGGYRERVAFLEAIGASPEADATLAIEAVLRPTFESVRPDKRTRWETYSPGEASAFLKRRLAREAKRKASLNASRGLGFDPAEANPPGNHAVRPGRLERELRARFSWEHLLTRLAALPPQQARVVFLLAALDDPDRPAGETVREVAQILGISPETVRVHKMQATRNPAFRRSLGVPLGVPQGEIV